MFLFINKNLKNATSNISLYEVLKKIGVDSKMGIYLRGGNFSTIYGILNLYLLKKRNAFVMLKIVILIHMVFRHLKNFLIK